MIAHTLRRFATAAMLSCAALAGGTALAESYPDRPIKWIVPWPAGGTTDVIARNVAQAVSEQLGVPIVVENKAGAAAVIGMNAVAKAPPDGYTFLVSDAAVATAPSLNKSMPFDTKRDLTAVAMFVTVPHVVIVSPASGFTSLDALIARARQDPDTLYFSSGGIGSPLHLAGEAVRTTAGIRWIHVPYKGGAPAILAVMSGDAQVAVPSLPSVLQQIQSGKLVALAVTGPTRVASAPAIPSVSELGYPGALALGWIGIHAPTGTPDAILQKVEQACRAALADPGLRQRLAEQGGDIVQDPSGAAYALFVAAEAARWDGVVKAAGIIAE